MLLEIIISAIIKKLKRNEKQTENMKLWNEYRIQGLSNFDISTTECSMWIIIFRLNFNGILIMQKYTSVQWVYIRIKE